MLLHTAAATGGLLLPFRLLPTSHAAHAGVEAAITYASSYVGRSGYWLGYEGEDRKGKPTFDCSGLVYKAWLAGGISWKRMTAQGQRDWSATNGLLRPYSTAQRGDLVFWGPQRDISHVGLCLGGGLMIDASPTKLVSRRAIYGTPYSSVARFPGSEGRNPIGVVDDVAAGVGSVRLTGWMLDPDALASSGEVHIYLYNSAGQQVDGRSLRADGYRPDVAAVYGSTPHCGFGTSFEELDTGGYRVDVYAINIAAGGGNVLLTSRHVIVAADGKPFGAVDAITAGVGTVRATGWMLDPDALHSSGMVHAYLYNPAGQQVGVTWAAADQSRPDVGAYYGATARCGFEATFSSLDAGTYRADIYAINTTGPGRPTLLASQQIRVSSDGKPFGSVDSVTGGVGTIQTWGWMLDPDALHASGQVHVYVYDSTGRQVDVTWADATGSRPDVAAHYGSTASCGYLATFTGLPAGSYTLDVHAINTTGAGRPVLLGSRRVTVT
jgi:cell wall-associated NlpC family hydrolase